MISRANVGPWILGFSYEIFWRDRKRLRKRKVIHCSLEKKRKRKRELGSLRVCMREIYTS